MAPEQAVYEIETIIGKATIIARRYPPTYDSGGFEEMAVEVGPSGASPWTMQFNHHRIGAPKLPRPTQTEEPDEGWDWE